MQVRHSYVNFCVKECVLAVAGGNTHDACYPTGCKLHYWGGYSLATGVPSTCFYVASADENYVILSLLLVFMLYRMCTHPRAVQFSQNLYSTHCEVVYAVQHLSYSVSSI